MIDRGNISEPLSIRGRFCLFALGLGLLSAPMFAEELPDPPPPLTAADEPRAFDPKPINLQILSGENWSLAVSRDGKMLAVVGGGMGDRPGHLCFWDLTTNKEKACISERLPIRSVAYSPDGTVLATGEFDNTAKLRDPVTGQVRQVLAGHTGVINALVFTPDSRLLITASVDSLVKVWDVISGKEKTTLKGHQGGVLCAALSADGTTLATGGQDATAKLWNLDTVKES
jgi:WD40 repeat protein